MDDEVIEDHVNGPGGMTLGDGLEPIDEEVRVFPLGFHPDEFPRPHINGTAR